MAAVPSTAGSVEEPIGPTEIIVPKSVTAEQLHTPATGEEEPNEETPKIVEIRPKVTNESRHSIGSYNAPNREKIAGASGSVGIGGGRSNRPSQSENTLAKSQSEIQVGATNSLSVSQTSKNSLMTFSSSGTFYDHTKKKVDVRIPPKPVQSTNGK
ncbi:uncharacterized protein LOC118205038, partial [Stegodyphus dumicola]|uniref:uncharacterized protein LOC118205038 n=1 Tax=Stegodyphus dumicola TaxID=202533 RepID=UPI0015AB39C7